ncbi:MAG: hypothetical protein JJ966_06920 [Balneolaceae bacterium]|nr:hypothetical protein [Balneolaceae bacterium]
MQFRPKNTVNDHRILFVLCHSALIMCIAISYRVWFPVPRAFPELPVFDVAIPFFVSIFSSVLFVLALFLLSIPKVPVKFKNLAIVFMIIYALGDYNRIQAWFFYFLVFIGIYFNVPEQRKKLTIYGGILSCVYLMSGVLKLNGGFANSTFIWFITPIESFLPSSSYQIIVDKFWITAPIVELSAGLGLLFRKTARLAAGVLIAMHILILGIVGPLGWNTNLVIWPWNLAFMGLLYYLFIYLKDPVIDIKQMTTGYSRYTSITLIVFFVLLPVLSIWNLWPKHLSGALYSGNKIKSEVLIPDELALQLQNIYKPPHNGLEYVVQPNAWAIQELQVALYPSERAHKILYRQLCKSYPEYSDYFVFISKPVLSHFTGKRDKISFFCSDFRPSE